MKTTFLFPLVLLALPAGLSGTLPRDLSVSSDLTYQSAYVFRGIKQAGSSLQPAIEAALPAAFGRSTTGELYGGVWGNFPAAATDRQLHYYGGLSFVQPEIDFATFDAGLTVYHSPNENDRRTHEFHLGALFIVPERPEWRPALFYFYDVDLRSHVGEGSVTYAYSLERIGLPGALDFTLLGGVQGGSRVKTESYRYYGGAVELPLFLSDYSLLTLGVHYATAEKATFGAGERGRNLFGSIGYLTFF